MRYLVIAVLGHEEPVTIQRTVWADDVISLIESMLKVGATKIIIEERES